ncbi:MAG: penicillin-binding protein, partial [Sciscionella sp.]|nr:penicillin-binding protein [Sciscionella sp.]
MSNQASAAIDSVSADMVAEDPPLVTTITDRNGAPLATLYTQYRIPTPQSQIAKSMQAAIVAIEDRRFYQHGAIDPKGALRAAVNDVGGGSTQGASTITQQYVKNYLVNVVDRKNPVEKQKDQEESIARKLREARIAIQIESSMSKDQILTGYLNVVSFSHNAFGVGAASKVFFGTTADKLTIPQAALLAGNVNNPILYDPWKHPKQALQRRNTVIDAMVANQSITKAQADDAKKAPLGVPPTAPNLPPATCFAAADDAGFFCDYVERYLEETGMTEDQIDSGGYTIKTTMDPNISRISKDAVNGNVSPTADGVANAFAVIQPGSKSHDVLAMVANRNFGGDASQGQTEYNLVSGVSNPFGGGSSFKIFTSAAALEQGAAGLDTSLPNPSFQCIQPPITNSSTPCAPFHNLGSYPDPISLRTALATSPNVAFVNLEKQVGLPNVLNMAYRLGLRHTLSSNQHGRDPEPSSNDSFVNQPQIQAFHNELSFTLGASQVSPLEMANVVATLKSGGMWCPPNPILSITDRNGKPVPVHALPCEQVVSPQVANALLDGM